ncbi:MAG: alpha/beta hydrolase [Chloroflexota bacterium]
MSSRQDFFARSEEMMRFYREGHYPEALAVTERLADEFPAEAPTTSFWRVCLLSVAGRTEAALVSMRQAMDEGLWWSERQLRADSDLAGLQGLPEFERMVALCNERQAAAQVDSKPELFVFEPKPGPAGRIPLLIALHARGSSPERDVSNWLPVTQKGWLLAMPQSSQLGSPNSYVWDDAEKTEAEIAAHFSRLAVQYPLDARRVILAGLSQGAARAIQLTLKQAIPARGFLAVVPGNVMMENLETLAQSAENKVRGYLVAGGKDSRYEVFKKAHALLNRNGVACEIEDHPEMGHEFPPDFDKSISRAMEFIFKE